MPPQPQPKAEDLVGAILRSGERDLVLSKLMEISGVRSIVREGCGCVEVRGLFGDRKIPCDDHAAKAPKTCPCGECQRLTRLTQRALRENRWKPNDEVRGYRAERIAHAAECDGTDRCKGDPFAGFEPEPWEAGRRS